VSAARKLTLSFDNGPSPDVTPGVLDVLAGAGVRAAFFVCGKDARGDAQRAILERAKRDGHRIGNHTLTHSVELGATADPDAPRREIGEAQEALGGLADAERLFRPYGGGGVLGPRLLSAGAVGFLRAGGYTCVLWNSVPRDWEDVRGWPERALRDVRAQDWTLVVLHDLPTGAMRELPRFLDLVRDAGVEIVPELPPDCVPILRGEVVRALDAFLPASA
jgi:peptidoglycan/xylan/chitin deacetylase (PgdA/CDA1 family)